MIFLNSASSAAELVFYLPGGCTHTDTKGKQMKARVRNIIKSLEKPHYLMNNLYIRNKLWRRRGNNIRMGGRGAVEGFFSFYIHTHTCMVSVWSSKSLLECKTRTALPYAELTKRIIYSIRNLPSKHHKISFYAREIIIYLICQYFMVYTVERSTFFASSVHITKVK